MGVNRPKKVISYQRSWDRFFFLAKARVFIDVFSRRATSFHRWAKLFELNFFARKISPLDGQTSWSICPVPDP